MIMTFF